MDLAVCEAAEGSDVQPRRRRAMPRRRHPQVQRARGPLVLEASEGTAREGALVALPGERTPAALHLGWAGRGGCGQEKT